MRPLWALLLAVVVTACNGDRNPTSPSPPPPPPPSPPSPPGIGAISIIAVTAGSPPDPDGYMLTMDDTLTRAIAVNGTITFSDLVGRESHSFAITGLAPNCTLASDNPLQVEVIGGTTVDSGFHIVCTGTTELRDQIVFISDRHGPYDIYVMNTDGSNPIRLTDLALPSYQGYPRFPPVSYPIVSPDGRKIAFLVYDYSGTCGGYVCLPDPPQTPCNECRRLRWTVPRLHGLADMGTERHKDRLYWRWHHL